MKLVTLWRSFISIGNLNHETCEGGAGVSIFRYKWNEISFDQSFYQRLSTGRQITRNGRWLFSCFFIHLAHQLFLSDKFSSQFVRKSLNKDTDCLSLFVPVMLESDSRHWVLSVPGHRDDSPDHPRIVPLWPSSNWAQPYITLQLN